MHISYLLYLNIVGTNCTGKNGSLWRPVQKTWQIQNGICDQRGHFVCRNNSISKNSHAFWSWSKEGFEKIRGTPRMHAKKQSTV